MVKDTPEIEPLESLAERIVQCANEADTKVLEAAQLIGEARSRVEAGEVGDIRWYTWAEEHIKLSKSRLRELLRISEADDPKKELERLRAQTRERVERHRAKNKEKTSAPLRNGGTEAKVVSEGMNDRTAPPTTHDANTESEPEPEPERECLIEWAKSAPLDRVVDVLSFIGRLDAAPAEPGPDRPAAPAAVM